jgi:hypothetical protein
MADIKLCDKCGAVFNPRGSWQALSAITFVVEDGRQQRYDSTIEVCEACAIDPRKAPNPTGSAAALGTGPRLVDSVDGIWQEADGSCFVKRDDGLRVGPFSSKGSASDWLHNREPAPKDAGSEG